MNKQCATSYIIICANILAQPLKDMAADIVQNLSPNGTAVLSGLLSKQEDEIKKVYTRFGLINFDLFKLDQWSTLVFTR